ncbi:MAG: HdeD family acid-resistance protein [Lachnospiraceae bacterium]
MKTLKENMSGILMCLFEILVGVLLFISPVGFATGIIVGFGVILLVIGIVSIVRYFRTDAVEAAIGQRLLIGLVALLGGLFCILKSYWVVATFPLLTILYGIAILLAGLGKIQWTINMLRLKRKKWFLPAISAVISLLCAAVILMNPFSTTTLLWMFTGVSLIVEAVFDMISLFVSNRNREKRSGEQRWNS